MAAEQRQFPRMMVAWRGAILLGANNNLFVKINNISEGGLGFLSETPLNVSQTYPLVMEVPALNNPAQRSQLPCKIKVMNCILSNQDYRVGVQFVEMAGPYRNMLRSWLNRGG